MGKEYPVGIIYQEGGKGSGHFGHGGRLGSVGGSVSGKGTTGVADKPWNTSQILGSEARKAQAAIKDHWNATAVYSRHDQRWIPGMKTGQFNCMQAMASAQGRWEQRGKTGQSCPIYKIDWRVLRALQTRGWAQEGKLPKLTKLGTELMQEFHPDSFNKDSSPK